jgi:hypothetical protein
MKFHVDFSLFSPTKSIGVVSGSIDSQFLPRVGELVALIFPPNGLLPVAVAGFSGLLRVEEVIHSAKSPADLPNISLESVTVSNDEDAKVLVKVLEGGFGLYFDPTNL